MYFLEPILILVIFITASVVWLKMLIDCARRDFSRKDDRVAWILVIVLLSIFGAILYWFEVYRKSESKSHTH
jgi:hypothetical protein